MHVLFLRPTDSHFELSRIASLVCNELAMVEPEERESSNFEGGIYYRSKSLGITVEVCNADGSVLPEYQYWVFLRMNTEPSEQDKLTVPEIATRLASRGLSVFWPSDGWGKIGWAPSGQTFCVQP